jgi:SAM-dependent methyltransferase
MELRADNFAEWDKRLFEKQDRSSDFNFYTSPRRVVHIDEAAIDAVTRLYREVLPADGHILDLMSSWRSHLPAEVRYARVAGLGMNADEMRDNPQLTESQVHSLNDDPRLPYANAEFDGACCCVSVQYLQKPVAVFREVARVLKPGAPFVVTFSNRCFPSKAINLWANTNDQEHLNLVALYFANAENWEGITMQVRSEASWGHDPLYAVWAFRIS